MGGIWDVDSAILTALSTNLYYLTLMYALSGIFVSGTVLILFNLLFENSPQETRAYCISTYNVLLAIIAFISPQIGIWMLETFNMDVALNNKYGCTSGSHNRVFICVYPNKNG